MSVSLLVFYWRVEFLRHYTSWYLRHSISWLRLRWQKIIEYRIGRSDWCYVAVCPHQLFHDLGRRCVKKIEIPNSSVYCRLKWGRLRWADHIRHSHISCFSVPKPKPPLGTDLHKWSWLESKVIYVLIIVCVFTQKRCSNWNTWKFARLSARLRVIISLSPIVRAGIDWQRPEASGDEGMKSSFLLTQLSYVQSSRLCFTTTLLTASDCMAIRHI